MVHWWLMQVGMSIVACSDDSPIRIPIKDPSQYEPVVPSGEAVGDASCSDGRCVVEAGAFWMGDVAERADASPIRQVTLSKYSIDQTEVTHERWQDCVDDDVCDAVVDHCSSRMTSQDSDKMPVTCVNWQNASDYCEWAGGRLPTEAEWEKAARGTEGAEWAWGPTPPNCNVANYRFSSSYCFPGVIEVGYYEDKVSPFGLYDTVGNAWEWVADWYDPTYYATGPDTDPTGPDCDGVDEDAKDGLCIFRVVRGGAFNTTRDTTAAHRRSIAEPWVPDHNMGFRCAYDGG